MSGGLRNYTRWRADDTGNLTADLLGSTLPDIRVNPAMSHVILGIQAMHPDEARLIGVRLIEAAALADGDRAIRTPAPAVTP